MDSKLTLESKLKLQEDTHNKIVKAQRNYKKSPKERITESYVQVRLDSLEELWSSFNTLHNNLIAEHHAELDTTEYVTNDVYDDVEELYIEFKTQLKTVLNSYAKPSNDETCKMVQKPSDTIIELPKIVIPNFSGKYTEWVSFRDLYLSLIHNNASLTDVQKMHYLKSYLTGEAEQLLRQIPISEANYERCWKQLNERYNNKRYLSHYILKRLLSQRNISVESPHSLKELMDTTNDCLCALSNLGIDVKSWDIIIIHLLTLKLDAESRKQWEFNVTTTNTSDELPTFKQFKEFLTNRYKALEFLDNKSSFNRSQNSNNNVNQQHLQNVNKLKSLHVAKVQCPFCTETHKLNACKKFSKENVESRRDFVLHNNICFICLGNNHGAKACLVKVNCKICSRRHHSLLHPRGSTDSVESTGVKGLEGGRDSSIGEGSSGGSGSSRKMDPKDSLVACFSTGTVTKQVLLATALVEAESKNGNNYVIRALLDQGSQTNFVNEATVQYLGLKKQPVKTNITGLGGNKNISQGIVDIRLKSRINPEITFSVQAYVLKSITSFLPSRKVEVLDWPELREFELADPDYHKPNKIDLLLGADVYSQVIQEGIKKGPLGSPVAQSTTLGWILSGAVNVPCNRNSDMVVLHCQVQEDNDLLKKFWELESDEILSKEKMLTDEEKLCENLFVSTTSRDEEGRYIVRLPFKTEDPDCKRGESRVIAEKRFKGLEAKFRKNGKFKQKYREVMEQYFKMGIIEEVPEPDEKREESVYLPHHGVEREESETTKLRIVYDASCKGKNGVSLNDSLMVGPTLQPDLRNLVMRWRTHNICLAADVVKMYLQVKVNEQDVDYQRLIWKKQDDAEIKDYRLLRVTFGVASAPFLAVRALQQVAYDHGNEYPLAAEKTLTDFYMDDLMTGCETIEEGIRFYKEMNELLNKAGFVLQKWTSNSNELLEIIKDQKNKEEKDNQEEGKMIKTDDVIKIVGLTWDRNEDSFRYTVKLPEIPPPVTKRKIISDISRLYDPLGWISPCIITAKAMIQKLWIAGVQWDEEVPKNIEKEWNTYRQALKDLENVQILRWVRTKADDVRVELHGFCDASKVAYAAVVYIRVLDSKGDIHVSLVTAKTKVAPVKQISIPRLELCGAVLLTRLMGDVAKTMTVDKENIHAWTDSTVVLAWINSHPSRWKVFVANRVSEILTSTEPHQWSHVPTKLNPADCASRCVHPSELKEHPLWFKGPEFLQRENVEYRKPKCDFSTELESVKVHCTMESEKINDDIFDRYSSLNRLIRVVAYCRRFLQMKNIEPGKKKEMNKYLTTGELTEALETCIRMCQNKEFEEEIANLKQNKEIKKKSKLKALSPFLDEKNILRIGGRLNNAMLKYGKKHPIIMPKHSSLTNLLISNAHFQLMHGGPQLMLNYLQNKYFIVGAKQLVKAHVRNCVTCIKNSAISQNQLMGELPPARITPARSFLRSGVDFAGPVQIRTAKGRGHKSHKGYICLFVCMTTRAVHVEAVTDLTSTGFLQAFKRFVARRGHCQEMWSDNGTNFIGASAEIQRLFSSEKSSILSEIAELLATNGTSWHFIPPHSPNFGGLWEAGIKSVKFHLKRVIGASTLTYEEISTVLAQIEACLNSLPLSRLTCDSDQTEILTPGHFLVGEALVTAPDRNYESSNLSSLRRWQLTQRMLQDFWRKWSQEYLTQFLFRYKWSSRVLEPNLGDIVVVKEDGLPPCRWLYGKIVAKHPGPDNITRVVTLKTKLNTIKRPLSKLCVLPVAEV